MTSEGPLGRAAPSPPPDERPVVALDPAGATEPGVPGSTSARRGAHARMVDFLDRWLMELGVTPV